MKIKKIYLVLLCLLISFIFFLVYFVGVQAAQKDKTFIETQMNFMSFKPPKTSFKSIYGDDLTSMLNNLKEGGTVYKTDYGYFGYNSFGDKLYDISRDTVPRYAILENLGDNYLASYFFVNLLREDYLFGYNIDTEFVYEAMGYDILPDFIRDYPQFEDLAFHYVVDIHAKKETMFYRDADFEWFDIYDDLDSYPIEKIYDDVTSSKFDNLVLEYGMYYCNVTAKVDYSKTSYPYCNIVNIIGKDTDGNLLYRNEDTYLEFGSYNYNYKKLEGYEIVGDETKTVKINKNSQVESITFTYKKIEPTTPKIDNYTKEILMHFVNNAGDYNKSFKANLGNNIEDILNGIDDVDEIYEIDYGHFAYGYFGSSKIDVNSIPRYAIIENFELKNMDYYVHVYNEDELLGYTVNPKYVYEVMGFDSQLKFKEAYPKYSDYATYYVIDTLAEKLNLDYREYKDGVYTWYDWNDKKDNYTIERIFNEITESAEDITVFEFGVYACGYKDDEICTQINVIAKDEEGNIVNTDEIYNLPYGVNEIKPSELRGYELLSTELKTVYIDFPTRTEDVVYNYKKLFGSIKVNYIDDKGNIIDNKILENLEVKDYTEYAKEIEGYELIGYPSINVSLDNNNLNQEINFIYKKIIKGSYTVNYKDDEGNLLDSKYLDSLSLGNYTENAISIDGYILLDESSKSFTLDETNPDKVIDFIYKKLFGKITINYKDNKGNLLDSLELKKLDLGEYTETAKQIDGYVLLSDSTKTVLIDKDNLNHEIDFIYKKIVKGSITVNYVDENNNLLDSKIIKDLEMGEYIEEAIEIYGYYLTENSLQTIVLDENSPDKTIQFVYKKLLTTLKVNYVDVEGNVLDTKLLENLELGTYTETAKDINNYKIVGETSKTIIINKDNLNPVIEFVYEKLTGNIKINYVDDKGNLLDSKLLENLELGTYTETAKDIDNYVIVGGTSKTVVIDKDNLNEVIEFVYKKITGDITINYLDDKGNLLDSKILSNLELGSYTETAKDIDNYVVVGETSKTVVIDKDNLNQVIEFIYKKVTGDIIINYIDDKGNLLDSKNLSNLEPGTYTEFAKDIDNYVLVGEDSKTVIIDKDNLNQVIEFIYKKLTGNITVNYIDEEGNLLDTKDLLNLEFGTYTETAKYIDNYMVVGESSKTLIIDKDNLNQVIEFIYKKLTGTITINYVDDEGNLLDSKTLSNLELGEYTESAILIDGYDLIGSSVKTVEIDKDNLNIIIEFNYTKVKEIPKGSIIINYNDLNGNLLDKKILNNLDLGTYIENAIDIDDYEIIGDTSKSIIIDENNLNHVVEFTYKKIEKFGSIIVNYKDNKGNLLDTKILNNLTLGTYTENFKVFTDYKLVGPNTITVAIDNNNLNHVIEFIYEEIEKLGSITVNYKDDKGNLLDTKVLTNLKLGTYTENSKVFMDYRLVGPATKTVTIDNNNLNHVIEFTYEKVEKLGSITVNYKDDKGALLDSKILNNLKLGTYTENSILFTGYKLVGTGTKTVIIDNNNLNHVIEFIYEKIVDEKFGSITVNYIDDKGNLLDTKVMKNLKLGTYTENSRTFTDYKLIGPTSKTVTIDNNKLNHIIEFTYEKIEKLGSITVNYKDDKGNLLDTKVMKNLKLGSYTENFKTFDGYRLIGPTTKTVTINNNYLNHTIEFMYEKIVYGSILINYKDDKGNLLDKKLLTNLNLGNYLEKFKLIDGYVLVGDSQKNVNITKDNLNHVIDFIYKKIENPVVGSIQVNYKTNNGTLLDSKRLDKLTEGNYLEKYKEIEGYTITGDKEKLVTITKEKFNHVIDFVYKKKNPNFKSKVIVEYVDSNGNLLGMDSKEYSEEDIVTVSAKDINDYTLLSEPVMNVALKDKEEAKVKFVYFKDLSNNKVCGGLIESTPDSYNKPKEINDITDITEITGITEIKGNYKRNEFKGHTGVVLLEDGDTTVSIDTNQLEKNTSYNLYIIKEGDSYALILEKYNKNKWEVLTNYGKYIEVTLYDDSFEDKTLYINEDEGDCSYLPYVKVKNGVKLKILRNISFISSAQGKTAHFLDVHEDHIVQTFGYKKVAIGKSFRLFYPNDYLSRGQMSALVSRALGLHNESHLQFKDTANNWSNKYLLRLRNVGIVKGYPDGTFRPNNFTTVEQLYNVLSRTAMYVNNTELDYDKYFKGLNKQDKILRLKAVEIMYEVFKDIEIMD